MDKTFNISVKSKQAKNLSKIPYVCGNTDYRVAFDFDDDWDKYPIKTARFVAADGTPYEEPIIDNQCKFPQIMDTFRVDVGVYAGDLVTTTPAVVECLRSIRSGTGVTPEVPEPDRYDQMMEAINADALRAEEAAAAAAESADKAAEEVQRTFDENMLIVRVWFEDGTYRASHTWNDIFKEKSKGKPVFAATSDVTYLCYGQEGSDLIFASVERTPYGENEGFHSKRLVIHNNNTISITKETVEMQQGGGIDEEQLNQAVHEALQEAKDSGDFNGEQGDDGFSPIVIVDPIEGGHRVEITDKDGKKAFEVMDGKDGENAEGGGAGNAKVITGETDGNGDITFSMPIADMCALGDELIKYEITIASSRVRFLVTDIENLGGGYIKLHCVGMEGNNIIRRAVNILPAWTKARFDQGAFNVFAQYNFPNPSGETGKFLAADSVNGCYQLLNPPAGPVQYAFGVGEDVVFADMGTGTPTNITFAQFMEQFGESITDVTLIVVDANTGVDMNMYSVSHICMSEDPENPPYILFNGDNGKVIRMDADGTLSYVKDMQLATQQYVQDAIQAKAENAGKLLYVSDDGTLQPLTLGTGLSIVDGLLTISASAARAVAGMALAGQVKVGEV